MTPRTSTLVSLGIVAALSLAEQVVFTRLFSAALAYHFSFLVISVAMLGTAAAAFFVYLRPRWFDAASPERVLSLWCSIFALTLMVAPLGIVRLDFGGDSSLRPDLLLNLAAACVLAAAPPFASGIIIAVSIKRYSGAIGVVYAFDLVGAGIGALLVVPILGFGSAPDILLCLGVAGSLTAVLFDWSSRRERQAAFTLAAVGAALAGVSSVTSILYLEPRFQLPPGTVRLAERWTPLARVFGFELPDPSSPALLFYDRVYATVPVVREGPIPSWKELGTGPASIGFEVSGPGRALIIGGGGGRDIYNALSSQQSPVDVIELLDGNRRVVDEDLGHLSGAPYSRPGVQTLIGDGRTVLAARDVQYDHIHLGFDSALTADTAQGAAMASTSLHTLEAYQEYFDHLKPGGVLSVSRLLKLVGHEALRATVLTLAALEHRGIPDPYRHVIVVLGSDILGPPTGTILARLTPFTDEEVTRIRRLAEERANGLLMTPGGPNRFAWRVLAGSSSVEEFCNDYPLDVCPPTDDRPFFFNMARLASWGRLGSGDYAYAASPQGMLLVAVLVLCLLCVVALAGPPRLARASPRFASIGPLSFFIAIGAGFLLFEVALVERLVLFLGFPTYALSVVLFSLLVSAGFGSYVTSRVSAPRVGLTRCLSVALALLVVGSVGLAPLLSEFMSWPLHARALLAVLVVAPFGFLLGMPMPLGLGRLSRMEQSLVPYAWAVNGTSSVLASVFGAFVATELGFTATSFAACGCYAFALAHAGLGQWPEGGYRAKDAGFAPEREAG